MKYYLAGPMTGIPQFNFPLFIQTTEKLRLRGLDIVSPVETDSEEVREIAMASENGDQSELPSGQTWGSILAEDVKLVADVVDAVIVLPGWRDSKGARLEVFVAVLCDKPVFAYTGVNGMDPLYRLGLNHLKVGVAGL